MSEPEKLLGAMILVKVISDLTVDVIKRMFAAPGKQRALLNDDEIAEAIDAVVDDPEDAESLRFLTRQRFLHRIQLARAKWDWLILTAYYHPKHGRTDKLAGDWNPRAIGDQLTVADFAGDRLPHETDIGENVQSNIRVSLLHNKIQIVTHLNQAISALDNAIHERSKCLKLPAAPWRESSVVPAWATFLVAVHGHVFEDLPNLNSYCGFKDLWDVSDTPGSGIRHKRSKGKANLLAYAAVIELASLVRQSHFRQLYEKAAKSAQRTPHQWALRKVASAVLKDLWTEHANHWSAERISGL